MGAGIYSPELCRQRTKIFLGTGSLRLPTMISAVPRICGSGATPRPRSRSTVMRRFALAACLLALATTGCQYAGPYVTERTEVRIEWAAAPSTTVYRGLATPGQYQFDRFEGEATLATPGAGRWGLSERREGQSSRAIAQPLGTDRAQLRQAGDAVELVFAGGRTCGLELVRGTWADYQAGREIVLALAADSWNDWIGSSHDVFLDLVDDLRRQLRMALEQEATLTDPEAPDILVDEKPLIRVDQRQMMIFLEKLQVSSRFEVIERQRDSTHVWLITDYELTPGARRFFSAAGEATALIAVEVGLLALHCARAARCCR